MLFIQKDTRTKRKKREREKHDTRAISFLLYTIAKKEKSSTSCCRLLVQMRWAILPNVQTCPNQLGPGLHLLRHATTNAPLNVQLPLVDGAATQAATTLFLLLVKGVVLGTQSRCLLIQKVQERLQSLTLRLPPAAEMTTAAKRRNMNRSINVMHGLLV